MFCTPVEPLMVFTYRTELTGFLFSFNCMEIFTGQKFSVLGACDKSFDHVAPV